MNPILSNTITTFPCHGLHMVMVSDFMPRHDASSSNFRIFNLLKMLEANGCKVTYLYCASDPRDNEYAAMFGPNFDFRFVPLNPARILRHIQRLKPQAVWLTNLWNIHYVNAMTLLCASLREELDTPCLILDTMDFHAKKHLRKFQMSQDQNDLQTAEQFLGLEQILYSLGDHVITVSEEEKNDIEQNIPGSAPVTVIPNVHPVRATEASPTDRSGLAFLGNYAVQHNVDAVEHFVHAIFPAILEKKPEVQLHLLGHNAREGLGHLEGQNVIPVGFVPDVDEALSRFRVFICPMPYGAGMKGKVGSAAACGLPIVTTSIGAEGFPFQDGTHCFIADAPAEFALKTLLLLQNDDLWSRLASNAKSSLAKHFGINAVSIRLGQLISTVCN
ncbi:glycosyltransferase family 4 protein [Desulfovibrio ferrophilus]|uniref:Glycosyl transferase family 2 n=1 Tax=Desulfovibrio ferrophilus TaxID=241368 RepID=A0A2Z6B1N3_9BACT|nr:glycosyltransferase family 4 protein [Desulfovibrio ferrophilus]BBD09306.1 glycosyl transferase family 2 [Desulfovibrio ferrophilus]